MFIDDVGTSFSCYILEKDVIVYGNLGSWT